MAKADSLTNQQMALIKQTIPQLLLPNINYPTQQNLSTLQNSTSPIIMHNLIPHFNSSTLPQSKPKHSPITPTALLLQTKAEHSLLLKNQSTNYRILTLPPTNQYTYPAINTRRTPTSIIMAQTSPLNSTKPYSNPINTLYKTFHS